MTFEFKKMVTINTTLYCNWCNHWEVVPYWTFSEHKLLI